MNILSVFRVFIFIVCFSILAAPHPFFSTACVQAADYTLSASHDCRSAGDCDGCAVERACSDDSPAGLDQWIHSQSLQNLHFDALISSKGFFDSPSQSQAHLPQGKFFFTPRLYSLYSEFRI